MYVNDDKNYNNRWYSANSRRICVCKLFVPITQGNSILLSEVFFFAYRFVILIFGHITHTLSNIRVKEPFK